MFCKGTVVPLTWLTNNLIGHSKNETITYFKNEVAHGVLAFNKHASGKNAKKLNRDQKHMLEQWPELCAFGIFVACVNGGRWMSFN